MNNNEINIIVILILTERVPCAGCASDIVKFDNDFLFTNINVFDIKGKILEP